MFFPSQHRIHLSSADYLKHLTGMCTGNSLELGEGYSGVWPAENSEVQYRSHSNAYATHILSVGGTATNQTDLL